MVGMYLQESSDGKMAKTAHHPAPVPQSTEYSLLQLISPKKGTNNPSQQSTLVHYLQVTT